MTAITLRIDGDPVGKGRPRFTRGRAYTPIKTRQWEEAAKVVAKAKMKSREPIDCPVDVTIVAYMPYPDTWPKWKKRLVTPHGVFISHTGKPDIDNIAKAALDAISGIVITDDARITDLRICKRYSDNPGVAITVTAKDMPCTHTVRKP
jgi:Holliday junction resolvase RusA-like endonuclease